MGVTSNRLPTPDDKDHDPYNGISRNGMIINYEVLAKQYQDLDREYRFLRYLSSRILMGHRSAFRDIHFFLDPNITDEEKEGMIKDWADNLGGPDYPLV